jgi:hypothetical protein
MLIFNMMMLMQIDTLMVEFILIQLTEC